MNSPKKLQPSGDVLLNWKPMPAEKKTGKAPKAKKMSKSKHPREEKR